MISDNSPAMWEVKCRWDLWATAVPLNFSAGVETSELERGSGQQCSLFVIYLGGIGE